MAKALLALSERKFPMEQIVFAPCPVVVAHPVRINRVVHIDLRMRRDPRSQGGRSRYIVLRLDLEAAELISKQIQQQVEDFSRHGEKPQGELS